MLDYASGCLISFVVSWNVLLYILFHLGFLADQVVDRGSLEFDQADPLVRILRAVFVCVVFVILIPLFLKKTLHSLEEFIKYFSYYIFFLYCFIFLAFGLERADLAKKSRIEVDFGQVQPFGMRNIPLFYTVLSCFYIQPYILTYKRNLLSGCSRVRNRVRSDPRAAFEVPQIEPRDSAGSRGRHGLLLLLQSGELEHSPGHPDEALLLQSRRQVHLLGVRVGVPDFQYAVSLSVQHHHEAAHFRKYR